MSMPNPHIHPVRRAQTDSEKAALRLLQRLFAYTGQLQPDGEDVRLAEEAVARHGLDLCLDSLPFAFQHDQPRPDGTRFWTKMVTDMPSLLKALDGDLAHQTKGYAQAQKYKVENASPLTDKDGMQDPARFAKPEVLVVEDGQQYDDAVDAYHPVVTDLIAGPCSDPNCSHEKHAFENGRPGCPEYFCWKDAASKQLRHRISPSFQQELRAELRKRREECDVCHNRLWILKRFGDSILVRDCPECLFQLDEIFKSRGQRARPQGEPKPAIERSFTANADADIDSIR